MEHNCPICQRQIYNRRLTHCGFCGAEIPADLRFSAGELAALDKSLIVLETRRAERRRDAEAEAERKRMAKLARGGLPRIF